MFPKKGFKLGFARKLKIFFVKQVKKFSFWSPSNCFFKFTYYLKKKKESILLGFIFKSSKLRSFVKKK